MIQYCTGTDNFVSVGNFVFLNGKYCKETIELPHQNCPQLHIQYDHDIKAQPKILDRGVHENDLAVGLGKVNH